MENKSKRSNRLGRGLSALIPEIKGETSDKEIVNIDIDKIYPNEVQPRKQFDEEKIKVLSESIKNYGVLQPIVVKRDENNKYMIIAGERRFRASKLANKSQIPAIIKDIEMKDIMEIALIENLQREDLNSIEEALAYKSLIEHYNVTQEEISEAVGKSRPHITNTLRLLNLGQDVIDMIDSGKITAGHGKALLRIVDKKLQLQIAKKIEEEELSVREVENIAKKISENKEEDMPKKSKPKDVFILDVEDKLRNIFGTKVNISKGKKKGKIEIEYYNDDDLNSIVSMLLE
ncbi:MULTISPECIES: ParB/RepB/Spo0J family partition protein [unclassified Clostridioides]|uniref:ParB/RepB/Spo0J family partition protein n=1 Tax=unclassified Clostridioides TaxID=2635829 RepID=UPI001D0CC3C6|nr:ParB/RepB/Spo0J family partition protein [Clostridioides sp. ES-S-0001-02]MCC0641370.1 ParB/RepB/Spo0J family partition protein [Clostridioides sp. ES-S-0049-03]MCC0658157.1 ParB/RepB/Spo0J family partition protein [Clostridioides sp. ES-S-0123-01]MCC0670867.1 ParB/RepB/Spo0J family partition protein [Clostridioides sp. ES-S-0145-01]MCC0677586.1 ParB/RepB/Spo0J family partition protein [Clostridioides sp. ES-W-0018-02]MCC0682089.1 ParB/RepB/Spo0J family partition protein [Clostridioides sp.